MTPSTTNLNQLLAESAEVYGNLPCAGFAFEPAVTYGDFYQNTLDLAAALKERGIRKGDLVAILADNSPQWGMSYFAIIRLGAVAVPILPDFPEADVRHILTETGAKIIFTNRRQLDKLYDLGCRLKMVITLDDADDPGKLLPLATFTRFLAEDKKKPGREKIPPADFCAADDLASIIYTSGTSGHAKAVMLSHANFLSNVRATLAIFAENEVREWTFLSILPMSHAYEFTSSFLTPLASGSRIVYAGKTPTPTVLEKICAAEKPDIMCLVPMVMEKIYKKRVLPVIGGNVIIRAAMHIPLLRRKIMGRIGRRLQAFFGGRLRLVAIGGAPLNIEVEKFLAEANFPYLVGYGLTEASPLVSAGPWRDPEIALGSAGKPVQGVEVKIAAPDPETGLGEIMVKGANVMPGYRNNPEATREAIDQDGWLATGDLGSLDRHGNLFIKGRSKSVIVLSHGENIYPEAIEEKLNAFPEVVESLVREQGGRVEAMVYLDYELLNAKSKSQDETKQMERISEVLALLKSSVNRQLPAYAQLARVREHREPFVKTATHKIKRYLYNSAA